MLRWFNIETKYNLYGNAIWAVRKVKPDYLGKCLRVRRSSDDAEMDIGFVGDHLDVATLILFIGSVDGFVIAWYDQSGNGFHLFQSVKIYQPLIILAGIINTAPNGKIAIKFYISYLTGGNILSYDQSIYFAVRCYFQTTNACLLAKWNLGYGSTFKGGYFIRTQAGPAGMPRQFYLRNSNDVNNYSDLRYGSYDRSLMFEAKVGEVIRPTATIRYLDGIGGNISNMDFTVGAMINTTGVPSSGNYRNTIHVQEINAFSDNLPTTEKVIDLQESYYD